MAAAPGSRWKVDRRRAPARAHSAINAAPLRVERMEVMREDISFGKRQLTREEMRECSVDVCAV